MYSKKTVIVNKTGIHARPASELVSKAKQYQSAITIIKLSDDKKEVANAKSIMEVLMLAMVNGTEIELSAEGADEEEAVAVLVDLITTGLKD